MLLALQVRGEFEGLSLLRPPEEWVFTVQQSGSTETREGVVVRADNEEEIPGSRGVANFLIKFDGAKKVSTISISSTSEVSIVEVARQRKITRQLRSLSAEAWNRRCGVWAKTTSFAVVTENDAEVGDVDLSEGDWYDVDDEGNSFGISSLEYQFVPVKQGKKKRGK